MTNQKVITKTICNSVNDARFPKEDQLPDRACRDNQVKRDDHVEYIQVLMLLILCSRFHHQCLSQGSTFLFHINHSVRKSETTVNKHNYIY